MRCGNFSLWSGDDEAAQKHYGKAARLYQELAEISPGSIRVKGKLAQVGILDDLGMEPVTVPVTSKRPAETATPLEGPAADGARVPETAWLVVGFGQNQEVVQPVSVRVSVGAVILVLPGARQGGAGLPSGSAGASPSGRAGSVAQPGATPTGPRDVPVCDARKALIAQ
jgi:hypothetical protein